MITREQLEVRLRDYLNYAENNLDHPDNPLDLRVARNPFHAIKDNAVFCAYPPEYDKIWSFVKDAEEWYVDVYENFIGENCAEYIGLSVCSWEE